MDEPRATAHFTLHKPCKKHDVRILRVDLPELAARHQPELMRGLLHQTSHDFVQGAPIEAAGIGLWRDRQRMRNALPLEDVRIGLGHRRRHAARVPHVGNVRRDVCHKFGGSEEVCDLQRQVEGYIRKCSEILQQRLRKVHMFQAESAR